MEDKNRILFSAQRQVVRRRVKYFQRFLSVCLLACAVYLVWYRIDSRETARKNQELQSIAWQTEQELGQEKPQEAGKNAGPGAVEPAGSLPEEDGMETENGPEAENGSETEAERAGGSEKTGENAGQGTGQGQSGSIGGFDALLRINPDLKGWISIPGTLLSLPVVQGSDNSYYLSHDFYGEPDRHGTIFVDCEADLGAGAYNTVIYGHHMRDGSMFGVLKQYRNEDFYREHPSFFITMPGEEWEYEILAVVRNDIFEGNKEDFQYYDYKQITNEEDFAAYCAALKENAAYDTGVEVRSGDALVTLCTCDYGSEDQRLLVVGRRKTEKTEAEDAETGGQS